jgi:hypothetical protein
MSAIMRNPVVSPLASIHSLSSQITNLRYLFIRWKRRKFLKETRADKCTLGDDIEEYS